MPLTITENNDLWLVFKYCLKGVNTFKSHNLWRLSVVFLNIVFIQGLLWHLGERNNNISTQMPQ